MANISALQSALSGLLAQRQRLDVIGPVHVVHVPHHVVVDLSQRGVRVDAPGLGARSDATVS